MFKSGRFRLFDMGAIVAAIVAVVLLNPAGRGDDFAATLVAGASRLEGRVAADMSDAQADAYRRWAAEADHFGAFALGSDGAWGAVRGYNDADMADRVANATCAERGDDCRIVARFVPETVPRSDTLVVSHATLEAYQRYLGLKRTKAFAISTGRGFGDYAGMTYRGHFTTRNMAENNALWECERRARDASVHVGDANTCRIIHSDWRK